MKTILLVEDNTEIRENMAEILGLSGYKVLTGADGKEGVALALEHIPDLIVCDIMMPVLDGYGVIHMLQKNPTTQHIPFIFLTAKTERSEIRKGMELGADDYITKPFDGTELLNAIESRLKKAELMRRDIKADLEGLDTLLHYAGSGAVLTQFSEHRDSNRYKKKQVIYAERNHPQKLYFIQKGKVKIYKTNEDGKELILALYKAGDFFGYTALLKGGTYQETAEAIEESEIALIPKEEFDKLIHHDRNIMMKFIELLANNVTELEEQLLGIAYNSLRKKVADVLITLQKKYREEGEDHFAIDLSRENLANMAGTAKESLIRTLSDFKDEKLIDIRGGEIIILDEKKLMRLVN